MKIVFFVFVDGSEIGCSGLVDDMVCCGELFDFMMVFEYLDKMVVN